jgi:hypothetical protein
MTENQPKHHGGRRPGAGRKPTLKPLAIIRLLDPEIRADLVAITAHQRQASGNSQLSQEQIVANLIRTAHRHLEHSNNQNDTYQNAIAEVASDDGAAALTLQLATDAATISAMRQEVSDILARAKMQNAPV